MGPLKSFHGLCNFKIILIDILRHHLHFMCVEICIHGAEAKAGKIATTLALINALNYTSSHCIVHCHALTIRKNI